MIKYTLTDNTIDNYILLNPTKQQIIALPAKISNFLSDNATDYNDDDNMISFTHITVPTIIKEDFCDIYIRYIDAQLDTFFTQDNLIDTIVMGAQTLKLPANFFTQTLPSEETEPGEGNGGVSDSTSVNNYGKYAIYIKPKSFDVTVTSLFAKNFGGSFTKYVTKCNHEDFQNTIWQFENSLDDLNRLFGSIVEVYDNSYNLKQIANIGESSFYSLLDDCALAIYPNNPGYAAPSEQIAVGDILRIFPRETYFDMVLIDMTFLSATELAENAYKYLMNDVVRDMTNGIFEVYDENGVTITTTGQFDGNVIQKYQISQVGKFEVRKKIN